MGERVTFSASRPSVYPLSTRNTETEAVEPRRGTAAVPKRRTQELRKAAPRPAAKNAVRAGNRPRRINLQPS